MLNHGHKAAYNCDFRWRFGIGLTVTAIQDIEEGDQLLIDYGSRSDDELLLNYGFVLGSELNKDTTIRVTLNDARDYMFHGLQLGP